jgi:hypothetical protein
MLSLQVNKKPICYIQNNNDKNVGEIHLIDKKDNKVNCFTEMEITDGHKFVHIPNQNNDRDVIYVAGQSGSGKSYYIKQYTLQYIKMYPKRPIYLFSYLKEDETLDSVKKIQRINIYDNDFMRSNLTSDDFKDCLVIYDDIDCIPNKKLKEKVMNLLQQCLQIGRHSGTNVCYACHQVCNGHETKSILNECTSITFFPLSMGNKKLSNLLDDYFGFDKEQIQKVKDIDSRACTIFKCYPKIVMAEHDIYIL